MVIGEEGPKHKEKAEEVEVEEEDGPGEVFPYTARNSGWAGRAPSAGWAEEPALPPRDPGLVERPAVNGEQLCPLFHRQYRRNSPPLSVARLGLAPATSCFPSRKYLFRAGGSS